MKTNTIQGFRNQTRIDMLREALTHIQKAYNIIIDDNLDLNFDTGEDTQNYNLYINERIEAESKISDAIPYICDAIGYLVSEDLNYIAFGNEPSETKETESEPTSSKKMEIVHKTKKTA